MARLNFFLFFFNFAAMCDMHRTSEVHLSHFEFEDRHDNVVTDPQFILSQTNTTGHIECAYQCHVNDSCQSYFYTAELQQCQLNNIDFWITRSLQWSHVSGSRCFYKATARDKNLLALQPHSSNVNADADAPRKVDATVRQSVVDTKAYTLPASKTGTTKQTTSSTAPTLNVFNTVTTQKNDSLHLPTKPALGTEPSTRTSTGPTTVCLVNSDKWTTIEYSDMSEIKYKVFTDKGRNQSEAWDLCRNHSADLLRFDTLSHLETFRDQVLLTCPDFQGKIFWVDGTNNNMVDKYVVTNGQEVPFNLWAAGKPNDPKSEHCIRISPNYNYKLNDMLCQRKVYTFCQTRYTQTFL